MLPTASKAGEAIKSDDKATDISQLYQIYPDEVLGSGQFGIVYGGKWHGGESAFSLLTLWPGLIHLLVIDGWYIHMYEMRI